MYLPPMPNSLAAEFIPNQKESSDILVILKMSEYRSYVFGGVGFVHVQ